MRFAIVGQAMNGFAVAALLPSCSPLAIIRAISFVVVDSFERAVLWTISHVPNEGIGRLEPRIANPYSPATIPMICAIVWIAASVDHGFPNVIAGVMARPVAKVSCDGLFRG